MSQTTRNDISSVSNTEVLNTAKVKRTEERQIVAAETVTVDVYLHTQTKIHTHRTKFRLCSLPVTSYQVFSQVEMDGRAVCIPGPLPCRLPVNHSMS